MEIQAKVTTIFPAEEFSKKDGSGTFRLRKVWAKETGVEYPQDLELTFMGNSLLIVDSLRTDQEYIFSAGITGRIWTKDGRQGINMGLRCWAAMRAGDNGNGNADAGKANNTLPAAEEPDDLPF